MIAKIVKGASFKGCVQYVTGKDNATVLASDGVLLGSVSEIADSFEYQRLLNPRCSKPVGHIALSFKPEDKDKLTDEMMTKIAREYMELMGIRDTQFLLVRHHNTVNPHCHLVYNRVDNNAKTISDKMERNIFMLAKRVSGISGKDVEEREGNGKRSPGMSYLCTCEGARMEAGKAKANRGSQTSKHCNNIQNTALKAVRPVPLPSIIVSLKTNCV